MSRKAWMAVLVAGVMGAMGCSEQSSVTPTDGSTLPSDRDGDTPLSASMLTPESTLETWEEAFTARDLLTIQHLHGGSYIFNTSPEFEGPESFTRGQVNASLGRLFTDRQVEDVTMEIQFDDAVPDTQNPDHMVIDAVLSLRVTMLMPGEDPLILLVNEQPHRFVFVRGPSASTRTAGWQVLNQTDLQDGGERPAATQDVSYTSVLALWMPELGESD